MTFAPLPFICATVLCALSLQGCDVSVPRHAIGNWESKTSYLKKYEWTPPGKPASSAFLNTCGDPSLPSALQCTGHGQCRDWNVLMPGADAGIPRLAFCECDRYYADPECKTLRKSQVTAFVLSLFLGMFGADQFYLGYVWYGLAKLLTLGGGGIWYLVDICRIGSAPVLTNSSFRVAADLPHFAFVLSVIAAAFLVAFMVSIRSIRQHRVDKSHELLLLRTQSQDEAMEHKLALPKEATSHYPSGFTGYGSTLPRPASMFLSHAYAAPSSQYVIS